MVVILGGNFLNLLCKSSEVKFMICFLLFSFFYKDNFCFTSSVSVHRTAAEINQLFDVGVFAVVLLTCVFGEKSDC